MSDKFSIDGSAVRELAEILNDTGLTEIEYVLKENKIRVVRSITANAGIVTAAPQTVATQPVSQPSEQSMANTDPAQHPGAVKSPMVGTAYIAAEPGAAPFVQIGDSVKEGQTLVIIEAMKVMNPIKSPKTGKITQIIAKDGAPVEFNEVLMIIE